MAGIHRSVELVRRRPGADIEDYRIRSSASGKLSVSVTLRETQTPVSVKAALYEDEQLTADGDWKAAPAELWSQRRTTTPAAASASNAGSTTLEFLGHIENVRQWTAETPHLYTLVLEEEQRDGHESNVWKMKPTQVESCRVGFRTIDVTDGILRCNGEAITICGINRHEHDPDHGKVVSLGRMKQDIVVLKENNFNAVRTSHYPAHSSFYRLCDFYGMYVCDEANVETHGMKPMGRLAHDGGWERAFVERVRRMVQRDRNHPCVIAWSLGNESGRGRNLTVAQKSLLALDRDRPVCYEGGGSWSEGIGRTELTDIVCPMYPSAERLVRLANDPNEDRPIILCEYSHSMNNSNGNLHLYWEAFRTFERLQGGFIWDMIDQGLRKKAKDGRCYFGYGGDFGVGQPSDRQFCINGMFCPDRTPHPSVSEIKYLQQPASIRCMGLSAQNNDSVYEVTIERDGTIAPIRLQIQNRYSFSDLSHLSWRWQLKSNHSIDPLDTGVASTEHDMGTVDISAAVQKMRSIGQKERSLSRTTTCFFLNIEGFLNKDTSWATSGHVLVTEQIPLKITSRDNQPSSTRKEIISDPKQDPLRVVSNSTTIRVSNGINLPFVTIDKSTGGIISIDWGGTPILAGGVIPNFTRAATDNDRGGVGLVLEFLLLAWITPLLRLLVGNSVFSYEDNWKQYGLSNDSPPNTVCQSIKVIEERDSCVQVEAFLLIQCRDSRKTIIEQISTYEIFQDGRISISTKVKPIAQMPSLPRVGMSFSLNPAFHNIQYFGRGLLENYPDRKAGSHLGWWKTLPSKMGYHYIVPSENGSRSDCGTISFELGPNGGGIAIVADQDDTFSCSALLHSADELHRALHTWDLDQRVDGTHPIYVNFDHRLMGLAGDDSWSPCVYPEFIVKTSQEYSYKVWLIPIPSMRGGKS